VHHHKRRPLKLRPQGITFFDRVRQLTNTTLVVLGLLVAGIGVTTVAAGKVIYYNYKGLAVYAPFSILIGLGVVMVVIFRWKKSGQSK